MPAVCSYCGVPPSTEPDPFVVTCPNGIQSGSGDGTVVHPECVQRYLEGSHTLCGSGPHVLRRLAA